MAVAAEARRAIQLVVREDDLGRPRLIVLFRVFLALPHVVWLVLWGVAAAVATPAAWLAGLATGRVPDPLHRFLSAYVRYLVHVVAFLCLVGRRFPGFTGRAGSYEIDVEIDAPRRQPRWSVGLRPALALPALVASVVLCGVVAAVGFVSWWFALGAGRAPQRPRTLGTGCLSYLAHVCVYLLVCTDRFPRASSLRSVVRRPSEPAVATGGDTS